MIQCDQIAVESARLKEIFTKCYNLKAIDLRSIVDLIESVSACSGGSFNLKTVNGQSLYGTGNIVITANVDGTETKIQQGDGIEITGAGSISNPYIISNNITQADGSETIIEEGANVSISGNGTIGTPYVINVDIPAGETQVNADWASVSGPSQILNKPDIVSNQDNFVRVLNIDEGVLGGLGTIEEQICNYILSLPEGERTILETDSKWNIVVGPPLPINLTPFTISISTIYELGTVDCVNPITSVPINTTAYHNGAGALPAIGDLVYLDSLGTIFYNDGVFVISYVGPNYDVINISSGFRIPFNVNCL